MNIHLLVPVMRFGVVLEKHTNIGIKLYENIEIPGVSDINFNSSYKLKMTLKRGVEIMSNSYLMSQIGT